MCFKLIKYILKPHHTVLRFSENHKNCPALHLLIYKIYFIYI